VHVSYHWLWLVPRELAKRSRTVPYQEGLRTSFDRPVAPGERLSVAARLVAPRVPGLYWLQWDMVEEGVTWFAQVSPRQPRMLVLVVPRLSDVCAVLPLVAALLGLLAVGRRRTGARAGRRAAAFADVAWFACALAAKPVYLYRAALLEPTAVAYWLTAAMAIVAASLALLLPRRVRAWTVLALGTVASLLVVGDVVYSRFFGDLLSAPALLEVGQAGRVTSSIRSLLTPGLVWLVVDLPFAAVLAWRLQRERRQMPHPAPRRYAAAAAMTAATLAIGVPLGAPRAIEAVDFAQMFRARTVVEQIGLFGYHAYDTWAYLRTAVFRRSATPEEIADVERWFDARAPLRRGAGPWFGAARGRNLIVVQVESLQDFAVDATVDGQPVMPFLHAWTRDALRFTNVTDQTNEGRTSDAEFVALASLLPNAHGAVAFEDPADHFVALPRVLAEHGYATLSAVPFEAGFWNRRVMHPSYGFGTSLFEPDFTMTEQIGWGLNDRDFLQQMVPRLERLPRPFCAWLITLSLHHPFDGFPARHKVLRLGAIEGTEFGNYLHAMRFLDGAFAGFVAALAKDGLLDDSVVALFGDHDAGFPRNMATARLIGIESTATHADAAWTLADRVPWFVRVPGATTAMRSAAATGRPAGQTDFAPTLAALLGIDPAPLPWMGRNLLGAPGDAPIVRPYGEWLDAEHLFLHGPGTESSSCYDIPRAQVVAPAACDAAHASAREARAVSQSVIGEDLQQRVRADLDKLVQ
jgi:phosphoglycerol transferase MdoB-like AlkP superfamily enzyme